MAVQYAKFMATKKQYRNEKNFDFSIGRDLKGFS